MSTGHRPIEIGSTAMPRDAQALAESFRDRYLFPLDPFQEEAIGLIAEGSSVIVSAPTGAGKTLIAEFAIFRALAHQHRIAYTTPLKALSKGITLPNDRRRAIFFEMLRCRRAK
jgi:superfamily II RNA helicase